MPENTEVRWSALVEARWSALVEAAGQLGKRHGVLDAQWVDVTGRNTRWWLDGLAAGDPAVHDALPTPPLTGEFADSYGEADLYRDLEIRAEDDSDDGELVHVYRSAWCDAVQAEVERRALYQLTGTTSAA